MLQNGNIRLRVMDESDVTHIQEWHNDYNTTRYTTLTSFVPRNYMEEKSWYERKINDPTSRVFMIDLMNEDLTVGFIAFSHLDYRNQKAQLSIVIGNVDLRGKGVATQALHLLEELLKNEFNIRKVSVQILSFNQSSLSLFRRNGYVEEGVFREEIYRDGRFYNLHILSKFL